MSDRNSLNLILKVLKLLSHQVRNPLNVISNDLSYLKSTYPDADCDRSISRCRQIADFFKPVDKLENAGTDSFDLTVLIEEVFEGRFVGIQSVESVPSLVAQASLKNTRQALIWLDQLFEIHSVQQMSENSFRFRLKTSIESACKSIFELSVAVGCEESIQSLLIEAVLAAENFEFSVKDNFFELKKA